MPGPPSGCLVLTKSAIATLYSTAASQPNKRSAAINGLANHWGLFARQDAGCTVTTTFTTTYGVTETYIPANKTSTFSDYTDFTQHTVTRTYSGGHAYAVATATTTTAVPCGATTITSNATATTTTTQDARCAPSAMMSQYQGYGLNWLEEEIYSDGATYVTTADDASACCQLCADAQDCASSAWDIRSNACRLQFDVNSSSGELECGQVGVVGMNDYGPLEPMAPGTGWYLAALCGTVEGEPGPPDDGT
ncbi:MAG: hypothetical protein M1821_007559 [Bathelium mastoideum]|nr:MAG: hypothetical protein M1821_007559 [Bathelium mastoideum]KAI9675456.1 MAG: hypothetical protein M1822_008934 [Bathelium mastoideum]